MTRYFVLWLISVLLLRPAVAATEPYVYVVVGDRNAPIVRAIQDTAACPTVSADGRDFPMVLRVGPATSPLRPTASKPEQSKPSAFPVAVCEAVLPVGTIRASLLGHSLALPKKQVDRIVVIGDTGCRLKGDEAQACNDPAAYPFAKVAQRAAGWRPELVLHVGDFHYRETRCPAGNKGCAGSPWGYGWDTWQADLFDPAKPLLAAAPWAVVRGNHENCFRAGQGWHRFLDVQPFVAGRDCDDPANDRIGDDSPVIAIPLGGGAQIVIPDLAFADDRKPTRAGAPERATFETAYRRIAALSADAKFTFLAIHKPILGFGAYQAGKDVRLFGGNQAIRSAFSELDPKMMPPGVDAILSGHIHLWEQVGFNGALPSQFISGIAGTQEDTVPLPASIPPGIEAAPGVAVEKFSSWVGGFGYMTLERRDTTHWTVKVWDLNGKTVNTCRIEGHDSSCDRATVN